MQSIYSRWIKIEFMSFLLLENLQYNIFVLSKNRKKLVLWQVDNHALSIVTSDRQALGNWMYKSDFQSFKLNSTTLETLNF